MYRARARFSASDNSVSITPVRMDEGVTFVSETPSSHSEELLDDSSTGSAVVRYRDEPTPSSPPPSRQPAVGQGEPKDPRHRHCAVALPPVHQRCLLHTPALLSPGGIKGLTSCINSSKPSYPLANYGYYTLVAFTMLQYAHLACYKVHMCTFTSCKTLGWFEGLCEALSLCVWCGLSLCTFMM